MVALLTSDPTLSRLDTLPAPAAARHRARHLHLLPSPGAGARPVAEPDHVPDHRPAVAWIGAALFASLLAVAMVRVVQEAPPATSWDQVYQPRPAAATPLDGESVWLVQPGDTLWSIAAEVAPGADRREVVQRLAERNGGAGLLAGQNLVIPTSVGNP